MRLRIYLLAALTGLAATTFLASASEASPGVVEVARFDLPVYVASAPENSSRVFVVEQGGKIRVLERGRLLPRPFLDLTPRVRSGSLRGLLSIAFAPNYRQSRRFYVFYSGHGDRIRIEEYRRSRSNPNVAMRSSRRTILVLQLSDFGAGDAPHQGGQLEFGPDGLLYISTGDGSRGFTDSIFTRNARDRRSLFGKILRIDPVNRRRPYGIPRSNPYAGRTPGRGEIFAQGLRNPWRFSFYGSKIFIADAGEEDREEVDVLSLRRLRGADFGWPRFEGALRLGGGSRRGLTFPALDYPHRHTHECAGAVVGGYVVRDRNVPSLYGRYLYADYCFQELRSFDPRDPRRTDRLEVNVKGSYPTSFGHDAKGQIYVAFEGTQLVKLVEFD